MKLRKSPRLKDFDYRGQAIYSLTLVTRQRYPAFRQTEQVDETLECLKQACTRYEFKVYAYCFMPDHLHLLVYGQENSSLKDLIRHFKQLSGYRYKARQGASLWQISYYDHVLKREEDLTSVARYIWDNPLRAGLAAKRGDYLFSGPKDLMEQA